MEAYTTGRLSLDAVILETHDVPRSRERELDRDSCAFELGEQGADLDYVRSGPNDYDQAHGTSPRHEYGYPTYSYLPERGTI